MTWEPMTEEAVFEYGEFCLLYSRMGEFLVGEHCFDGFFRDGGHAYARTHITHFARITNPNEVKP